MHFCRPPLYEVWNIFLRTGSSPRGLALKDVFGSLLDPVDFFLKQKFSTVHRIGRSKSSPVRVPIWVDVISKE